jgi:hypothetical protein
LKRNIYNLYENKKKKKGKDIKRIRGDYEYQNDKATKIKKKKIYYLYQELKILTLNYTS